MTNDDTVAIWLYSIELLNSYYISGHVNTADTSSELRLALKTADGLFGFWKGGNDVTGSISEAKWGWGAYAW